MLCRSVPKGAGMRLTIPASREPTVIDVTVGDILKSKVKLGMGIPENVKIVSLDKKKAG